MTTTASVVVDGKNQQVVCVSSTPRVQVSSHADPIVSSGGAVSVHCSKQDGRVQCKIAREPVNRTRYVIITGNSGTVFACSRCNKQYIHRKSLNKHWNDKHASDTADGCSCVTVTMFHHLSDSEHGVTRCSSLPTHAVHSDGVCSSTRQDNFIDWDRTALERSNCVRDSVLWHSLAALHSSHELQPNSFYCTPMPAHIGGRCNVTKSFWDDDCQVLDLSKDSCDVHHLSSVPVSDTPIDLSLKSGSLVCVVDTLKSALPLRGFVETGNESAVSLSVQVSAENKQMLKKAKSGDRHVAKVNMSTSASNHLECDSVAVLRHLRSGIVTSAMNQSCLADHKARQAAGAFSKEFKSCLAETKTSLRTERYFSPPQSNSKAHNTIMSDHIATSEETHQFFGGVSRAGHIRCKKCDFLALSMLLFSQHVAQHVKKTGALCVGVQHRCGDATDDGEYGFFTRLGLYRTGSTDITNVKQSDDGHYCAKVKSSGSKCLPVDELNVIEFVRPDVQVNGVGNDDDGDSRQTKKCCSDSVQQNRGRYQRGLGLTTTESKDAAGRSWRRRRLRTCDRCGYVTDNLTTLKRHRVKHGALGMYRCKLCDYTVNQQHILEYHTRNVHRTVLSTTDTRSPLDDVTGEFHERNAASTPGGGQRIIFSKGSQLTEYFSDNIVSRDCDPCSTQFPVTHSAEYAVGRLNQQTIIRSKHMECLMSVTLARRHLLDSVGLQVGRGICVRCGFRSLNIVRMKQHMLLHPHDRHSCSSCSHTSLTAHLLCQHTRQHKDCRTACLAQKKTYHCPECPFLAPSSCRLRCHAHFHRIKRKHACGKCSYSVNRAKLLIQHRHLHESAVLPKPSPSHCWLHCSKCPFKTVNKCSLTNHERGHDATTSQYMCSVCGFGTDVKNVAFAHQQLHSAVSC